MWRDDAYLLDMLLAARKALEFTQGMSREQFLASEVVQQAVMRLIQVTGEAARQISPGFKEAHPDIPWTDIVGMRHRLVHEYFRINTAEVWLVVERDLPGLIPRLEPLVEPDVQP
jgi:uncharacterized protein with HEPN domain